MKEEEKKEKRFISLLSDTTFKHLIKIEDYRRCPKIKVTI